MNEADRRNPEKSTKAAAKYLKDLYKRFKSWPLAITGYFAGAGRFEGANLIAQHIIVFHRGSNDMIVNPQQSLSGELRGSGDLISVNTPLSVDVEQYYIGELIFDD